MTFKPLPAFVAALVIIAAAQIPARADVYISTLFSNGGAGLYEVDLNNFVAESFITGTGAGYTLNSVQITANALDSTSNLVLSIYSNNGINGTPNLSLFTLTGANPSSTATYTFTPTSAAPLAASTHSIRPLH